MHTALRRWQARNMRADNSSAIVVYIEKKKMEPKNGGTAAYTERWTSANKSEHTKVYEDANPDVIRPNTDQRTQERKPLKEMTEVLLHKGGIGTTNGRKRPSKENNNMSTLVKRSKSSSSAGTNTVARALTRRRSTRIAVKRCEYGLTRSAARKRASM